MNRLEYVTLKRVQEILQQARFELGEAQKQPQGVEAENIRVADSRISDAELYVNAICDNMIERSYDGG